MVSAEREVDVATVSSSKFQVPPHPQEEPEACFQQAIEIARRQEAKMFELRAATGLARLMATTGQEERGPPGAGRGLRLATEGFDTADLQEAKALLDISFAPLRG